MISFFKLVQIPLPKIVTLSTNLSEEEIIAKLSSETVKKSKIIGKPSKLTGDADSISFELVYNHVKYNLPQTKNILPVKLRGISFDKKRGEIQVEMTLDKLQGFFLRFSNRFMIFWWLIWAPLTLLFYPALLMKEGSLFYRTNIDAFGGNYNANRLVSNEKDSF